MEEKNTMDRVKQFWGSKNKTTKRGIVFSAIALVVLLVSLVFLYTRDSYEFLLSTTDEAVSAKVIAQLKEQNVKYDVKDKGIYVTGVNPASLKLELFGEGILDSTTEGLELVSKPLFISEKQETTLLKKDLENTITSAIKSYNEVANAKVILTLGKDSSFANDKVPATAAVQLQLKSNLSSKQIKSIQAFVAASVPNLSASDVVITDTNNNLLSSGGVDDSIETSTAYTKSLEDKISSQISDLLSGVFPNTNFKVISSIDVNFDQTKIEKETVSSGPDTIISHETHSEITTNKTGNTTVGTESNVPSYETPNNKGESISESKSEIINYETNKIKEQITKQPEIKKVNVAVSADKSLSAVDIEKIRELVETASGYDEKRGDKVTVYGFDTELQEEEKEGFTAFIKNNIDTLSSKLIMLVIIIACVIVALKLISLFKKETPAIETEDIANIPGATISQEGSEEQSKDMTSNTHSVSSEMRKKKEILQKEIDENPQQVASVFKTWLDKER